LLLNNGPDLYLFFDPQHFLYFFLDPQAEEQ